MTHSGTIPSPPSPVPQHHHHEVEGFPGGGVPGRALLPQPGADGACLLGLSLGRFRGSLAEIIADKYSLSSSSPGRLHLLGRAVSGCYFSYEIGAFFFFALLCFVVEIERRCHCISSEKPDSTLWLQNHL